MDSGNLDPTTSEESESAPVPIKVADRFLAATRNENCNGFLTRYNNGPIRRALPSVLRIVHGDDVGMLRVVVREGIGVVHACGGPDVLACNTGGLVADVSPA